MTDQEKIDNLHNRVSDWSERVKANSYGPEDMMHDPEFKELVGELMEQDMDILMILFGKALQENGDDPTFDFLGNTYLNDGK